MGSKKWSEIRRQKVPADQEATAAASGRALRAALAVTEPLRDIVITTPEQLSEIRKAFGVTQVELALRLGKSQGNVSELERRDDVFLSSLREYIEALGGQLEVSAVFDGERRPIAMAADRR